MHQIHSLLRSQHTVQLVSGAPAVDTGEIGIVWHHKTYKSFLYIPGLAWQMWRCALRWKPDLVHIHQPLLGWLAHLLLPNSVRRIYHFHSFWGEEKQSHSRNLLQRNLSRFKAMIEKSLLKRIKEFIVLSEYSQRRLFEIVPQAKVHIIPGAVDLSVWDKNKILDSQDSSHKEISLDSNVLKLLSVRRLDPRMGLDLLLHAVAGCRKLQPPLKVELCIVGTGREEHNLKQLAETLNLSRSVKFMGRVEESELKKLMLSHHGMVIPSRALEGFGLSVIEAWAAGLPVLATSIGGLTEFSKHGEAICLVGEPTVEHLVEGIKYAAEHWLRNEDLASHCCSVVKTYYSFEVVASALMAVYEEET